MDEGGSALGLDEGDRKPDAYPREGAHHQRQQDEKAGVEADVFDDARVTFAVALELGQHEEEAASDGEVGDENVDDGHARDEQPAA